MKTPLQKTRRQRGFSLLELMISMAVMLVVLGAVFRYITVATRRSAAEETKMDLTQQAREFVDEFERDLHQVGYPGCRLLGTALGGYNCNTQVSSPPYLTAVYSNTKLAAGLVRVSNYQVILEGDVDGDGVVDTVRYRLVDSAGNFPPSGTCPCSIQRSQLPKINGDPISGQTTPVWSQELQNVVNSGNPGGTNVYGGGLPIAGNTVWGQSNTAYYAAVSTFKDFPVFTAYSQDGLIIPLPLSINPDGPNAMAAIKSVRLTINLLANANNGYDQQTHIRPVMTLVGNGRIANCPATQSGNCN